jgi:phosphoglycolate phosphatase-like HAD superfamily hydrolase
MKSGSTWFMLVLVCLLAGCATAGDDLLPSWRDGEARQSIIAFVKAVTTEGGEHFVPVAERIAVFDNDGCLWSEKPLYFQLQFAMERVKALAPEHPEWADQQPFKAVLEDDTKGVFASGEEGLLELVMATHTGMTPEMFRDDVRQWLATARHPRFDRPYTDLVYQPMLELLNYLRANGFKTFIVSGGGIEFLRTWAEEVYGIPPEQVIGSSLKLAYEEREGVPMLITQPGVNFIDDKEGKPMGIQRHIGRRPILAFGNSDGDLPMLSWTAAGGGARFCGYVHHTDAEREWAYDRESSVGRLDKGLDRARNSGWTVVDMKKDWKVVYPFELK